MNIDDFNIKIKKYDREQNVVQVHVEISKLIEIRGFVVRYTPTKYTHGKPVWIVTPPSVPIRNKFSRKTIYFWIFRCKDIDLWKELEKRIIDRTIEYTNNI